MEGVAVGAPDLGVAGAEAHILAPHDVAFVEGSVVPGVEAVRDLELRVDARVQHPLFLVVLTESREAVARVVAAGFGALGHSPAIHIAGGIDGQPPLPVQYHAEVLVRNHLAAVPHGRDHRLVGHLGERGGNAQEVGVEPAPARVLGVDDGLLERLHGCAAACARNRNGSRDNGRCDRCGGLSQQRCVELQDEAAQDQAGRPAGVVLSGIDAAGHGLSGAGGSVLKIRGQHVARACHRVPELCHVRICDPDRLQHVRADAADANARVGDPVHVRVVSILEVGYGFSVLEQVSALLVLARHTGVVERHDLEAVVQHWRSAGALRGVAHVPDHVGVAVVDALILADRKLPPRAARMLDDGHPLLHQGLSAVADQPVVAEGGQLGRAVHGVRVHRHQRKVERCVAEEEEIRAQAKRMGRLRAARDVETIVELRDRGRGLVSRCKDVMVSEQQRGRDHEARRAASLVPRGCANAQAAHGLRRQEGALQVELVHQVVGPQQPLQLGFRRLRPAKRKERRAGAHGVRGERPFPLRRKIHLAPFERACRQLVRAA
ncbi:MAG: hypothetical protein AVDCRST_MAG89-1319 [uncultured Gemmatimonadetes bacterium]|uniref:Uncharacterized protein n=1 Tax=uncultured Gemmatimonadota bacterium TaxID=203437 RepID=A0A6J4KSH4_9BACT|nr:MAG: hypothetical protein AVDCRST_MAG89-1319 [uncultured Gemmatimonadota bacterium]